MSGNKDCQEFSFPIVKIVISVSNVTSLWDFVIVSVIIVIVVIVFVFVMVFLLVRSCPLITLVQCLISFGQLRDICSGRKGWEPPVLISYYLDNKDKRRI